MHDSHSICEIQTFRSPVAEIKLPACGKYSVVVDGRVGVVFNARTIRVGENRNKDEQKDKLEKKKEIN